MDLKEEERIQQRVRNEVERLTWYSTKRQRRETFNCIQDFRTDLMQEVKLKSKSIDFDERTDHD